MPARFLRSLAVLALAAALVPLAAAPAAAAVPAPIVVNSLGDVAADDGACTLREAILAGNTNAASGAMAGECIAGVSIDTVIFSVPGVIELAAALPAMTASVTIDGAIGITIDAKGHAPVVSVAAGSTVVISNLAVSGAAGANLGAVHNAGNLTLSHVTLSNSASSGGGGGLTTGAGGVTRIVDSVISGNTATAGGGGVYAMGSSTTTIERSTIDGNRALLGGGIYVEPAAVVTLLRSTISHNTGFDGAGARTYGVLNLRNSTVAENAADTGATGSGGISVMNGGTLNILASTIALNASDDAAGVWFQEDGHWTMANGLVLGNTGADWSGSGLAGAVNSFVGLPPGHTIGEYLAGGLADHGGPTKTIALTRASGNLALNRGKATVCAASPISGIDQRGVARPTLCDVGAFELDTAAPTVSVHSPSYLRTQLPAGGKAWAHIGWTGADGTKGSGIASYDVSRSVNGGAWVTVSARQDWIGHDQQLVPGASYRFRVRARDRDGNTGSWRVGPSFTGRVVNETSTGFRYAGSWYRRALTGASGGYVKAASKAGASATFTFTGRAIGLVTSIGPTRGKARISVNGSYVTTIDMSDLAALPRVVLWTRVWSTSATRTVKVVVVGTAGRPRVDIDAFLVMR